MFTVAKIFSSGMILQRGKPFRVWGTGGVGEQIIVSIQGQQAQTQVFADGTWSILLPALVASIRETMTIQAKEDTLVFSDIAVGEVFVAAGQSNMEFWMRYEPHYREVLPQCHNPHIRFYDVPKLAYPGQEDDFDYSRMGLWRKATKEDLEFFSAVGYYFARALERELSVPIGIVGCNWGGTRSSAWMRKDHALAVEPEQAEDFQQKLKGQSYTDFCREAGQNPGNDSGKSNWDPFTELFFPRTPSQEEIDAFYADVVDNTQAQPQAAPGCLYENMVLRATPFAVRGVLWYQGESDDDDLGVQPRYKDALQTIIADWRAAFQDERLPFFIVQLPGFRSWLQCVNHQYSIIRRKQQETADEDLYAYLCSISDAGEEFDIHPKNKKVVGERLALLALKYLFGKDHLLADPPRCRSAERTGKHIALQFDYAGDGLVVKGSSIEALNVMADGRSVHYTWQVSGSTVLLELEESVYPAAVRVCFATEAWYQVNLYNQAGLPAIPFEVSC